jgi:hypothetical protein
MANKWLWVGAVVVVGIAIYLLGQPSRRTELQEEAKIVSLVLLRRTAEPLTVEQVRQASVRAFGGQFTLNNPNADRSVTMTKSGLFVVRTPAFVLGVINRTGPYMENPGAVAEQQEVVLLKQAIQEHRSWLAVDWIEGQQPPSYGPIGKLLAELADENDLAIYCLETGEMNTYTADLLPLLRGPEPLAALRAASKDAEIKPDKTVHQP